MTWNGDASRAIREAQKMGLRALARKTGLDRGYLGRLERGEIRKPAGHTVELIARGLQVDPRAVDPEWVDPAALNSPDEETT